MGVFFLFLSLFACDSACLFLSLFVFFLSLCLFVTLCRFTVSLIVSFIVYLLVCESVCLFGSLFACL